MTTGVPVLNTVRLQKQPVIVAALLLVVGYQRSPANAASCSTECTTTCTCPAPASLFGYNVKADFFAAGNGVTDDLQCFKNAIRCMPGGASGSAGDTLYIPAGEYRLTGTWVVDKHAVIQGAAGAGAYAGNGGTLLTFPQTTGNVGIQFKGVPSPRSDWSVMRDVGLRATGAATNAAAHGIQINAHGVRIENCYINGFPGNGIEISDDPINNNANNWRVEQCTIVNNQGHGFHVDSSATSNTNAGTAIGVDSHSNQGWNFLDESFLGNTYIGCHAASVPGTDGNYKSTSGGARSLYLGCYSEGAEAIDIAKPALVIGGQMTSAAGTGNFIVNDGRMSQNFYVTTTGLTAGYAPAEAVHATTYLGRPNDAKTVLEFQSSDDQWSYGLKYNPSTTGWSEAGWFDLTHGGADARKPLSISAVGAAEGAGQIKFNNGFYMGALTTKRKYSSSSSAPSGSCNRGDVVFNINPSAASYVGWVCALSGGSSVWKGFGAIAP